MTEIERILDLQHMTAWKTIVRWRLDGTTIEVTPEMDWPPLGDTQARDWLAACAHLQRAHSELREVISRFEPALLGEITSRGLSAYVLMHGIVQHDLWHAGQIMLLRKGFV